MSKEKLNDKKYVNNNTTSEIWLHNELINKEKKK